MQDYITLKNSIESAFLALDIDGLKFTQAKLDEQINSADFYNDKKHYLLVNLLLSKVFYLLRSINLKQIQLF